MKTITSILFTLLLTNLMYSQEGWNYQNSDLTNNGHGAIYALNSDIVFVIADNGEFLKTTDGGENWTKQNIGISESFYDIFFYDNNFGIAVGANGTLIKTNNGGIDWVAISLGIDNDLQSIHINNLNSIWVVGSNGIILFSDDIGNNWIIDNSITTNNLSSVLFRNENVGYITGDSGLLLSTTNGGNYWEINDFGSYVYLSSLSATENYTFMLSGDTVFKTSDGINWTTSYIEPGYEIYDLFFQNDNLGFGIFSDCTTNGDCVIYINKTIDSALNWTDSFSNDPPSLVGYPNIQFITDDIGYALSGNNILKTIDGGTFISVNEFESNKLLSIYPNPTNGIVTLTTESSNIQQIKIQNVIGELIFKENYDNQATIKINISNYPTGTYFVRILDNNLNTSNVKLIKNN